MTMRCCSATELNFTVLRVPGWEVFTPGVDCRAAAICCKALASAPTPTVVAGLAGVVAPVPLLAMKSLNEMASSLPRSRYPPFDDRAPPFPFAPLGGIFSVHRRRKRRCGEDWTTDYALQSCRTTCVTRSFVFVVWSLVPYRARD